ncbi:MAG: hypothetical protein WCO21_03370 [bacterium]
MNKKILLIATLLTVALSVWGVDTYLNTSKTINWVPNPMLDSSNIALSIGETKSVNGIKITLNKIASDSRCPIGVQCIQAGTVVAEVQAINGTDTQIINVEYGASKSVSDKFNKYNVSLIEVAPNKTADSETNISEYKLTFRINILK